MTDFLASHNISAQQIQDDFNRRMQEAEQRERDETEGEDKENEDEGEEEDIAEKKKRKRKEEKMLMKVKQSKEFKKRKYEAQQEDGSDAEDDNAIAKKMMATNKRLPGQLDNCEVCEKRFTVTPYSKTGPNGGLLCVKCSKELKDDEKKAEKASKKKPPQRARKRQTESDRMMGDVKPGAKSLVDACVKKVADVVNDIDDFGDMPQSLLDRLSQILSKKRVLSSRTLNLFLREDIDTINVYDSGKLEEEDFERMFAYMPHLRTVNLRFAGQLKDDAMTHMTEKCHNLTHLQLGATNLISDEAWLAFFRQRGVQLESLKLSELGSSFTDEVCGEMVAQCSNLKRLKIRHCSHLTVASVPMLANLTSLEHLTLYVAFVDTPSASLVHLINTLGPQLRTLCLEGYLEADDTVLSAIHSQCNRLAKIRLTGSSNYSDTGFSSLFTKWLNAPLTQIDLSSNRDIDATDPEGPQDDPIGFGSTGIEAMMLHSGSTLEKLDLHSCRHISHQSLLTIFNGKQQYPALKDIDLSFITMVDDVVMNGIFKSCPALNKLAVFACFNATGARIPSGVAVIGLPNAQDNIVQGETVDLA